MCMKDFLYEYLQRAGTILSKSSVEKLNEVAELLMDARSKENWIFTSGNGGSSATASHFVNDFLKGLSVNGKKRFKTMSLNDSVPVLTALANDYSYDQCYVEQLKNYGSPGDVFVTYTGSGNSENVINAAKYAKSINMRVIAFTGRDGGKINEFCDINCIAPTDIMEEIEDVHMVWEHALVCAIKEKIKSE